MLEDRPPTFPAAPERIFRTGRNGRVLAMGGIAAVPTLAAGVFFFGGLSAVLRGERGDALFSILFGLPLLGLFGFAFVSQLLVYVRSAIALTPEGLYFRNWRGRLSFVPWAEVAAVDVYHWAPSGPRSQAASTAFLHHRTPWGDTARLKLSCDSNPDRLRALGEELARRAGLVPDVGAKPSHQTWVRPANGEPQSEE